MSKAVFLDRDGVINAMLWNDQENGWDSPYRLDDFQLLPGVGEAIRKIHSLGYLAIVVSNQPGIAKKKCDRTFLEDLNVKMKTLLAQENAGVDDIFYCLHHPQAVNAEYQADCDCRKPRPGLLLQAAKRHDIDMKRSFFVGDHEKDVSAGLAAGCTPVRVANAEEQTKASMRAANLLDAVLKIEGSLLVKENK